MKSKKTTITIKEIAEKAGVSISTVSRVINHYKWVNADVKARVLAVMQELHYSPNYNAAAMAKGRSNTIVILVPNIVNPFFTSFVSTAMHLLRPAGYIPLVYETDNDAHEERALLLGNIGQLADGIISVTDTVADDDLTEILDFYAAQHKPILFVDRNIPATLADSFLHDSVGGVEEIVTYFIRMGHSKIAMILGDQGISVLSDKVEGYRRGLEKNGISFRSEYLRMGKWDRTTGAREISALLALPDPPTAVFAANNYLCLGVLEELEQRGIAVGKDFSVIGTEECERDILDFEKLGITNLRLDSETLAQLASERMLERLEQRTQLTESSHSKTIFQMKFVERSSVAFLKKQP